MNSPCEGEKVGGLHKLAALGQLLYGGRREDRTCRIAALSGRQAGTDDAERGKGLDGHG